MNWQRILRISNYFLLLNGFQLHRFEPATHRYRLSLWGIGNFIILTLFYVICVNQHFSRSPLLQIVHDVSPFFWQLIRIQILLGLKIYIFRLFTMAEVGRACDGISRNSIKVFARKFSMEEAFAYFLIFSTILISLCFGLYIAYEMDFKPPPWDNIFISFGLFIPHFALAGALKFYTLHLWFLGVELRHLKSELANVFDVHDMSGIEIAISATNSCVRIATNDAEKPLEEFHRRFEQLAGELQLLSNALEKDLLLLLVLNSSCLLAGVYTYVYFQTSWHLFFSASWKRIFYAANLAIYVLVFWDYLCLCTSVCYYNKMKSQILARIQVALKSKTVMETQARAAALKAIRNVLALELKLRLFNAVDVSIANLLLVHILWGVTITVVVTFHYLNDKTISIDERLLSIENDD